MTSTCQKHVPEKPERKGGKLDLSIRDHDSNERRYIVVSLLQQARFSASKHTQKYNHYRESDLGRANMDNADGL